MKCLASLERATDDTALGHRSKSWQMPSHMWNIPKAWSIAGLRMCVTLGNHGPLCSTCPNE